MTKLEQLEDYLIGIKYYESELEKYPNDDYVQTEFARRKRVLESLVEDLRKELSEEEIIYV